MDAKESKILLWKTCYKNPIKSPYNLPNVSGYNNDILNALIFSLVKRFENRHFMNKRTEEKTLIVFEKRVISRIIKYIYLVNMMSINVRSVHFF